MARVAQMVVNVRIVFANRRALRAMRVVANCLEEVGDDMPWRPEIKRAAKAARYAFKNMAVQEQPDD